MRIRDAIESATMGDKKSMDAARRRMKDVDAAEIEMRLRQAAAVPQIFTDNPVEFGLIQYEVKRRERVHNIRTALLSAIIGGLAGAIGGLAGAVVTIILS